MPDINRAELAAFVKARTDEELTRTASDMAMKQSLAMAYEHLPADHPSASFVASVVAALADQWSTHPDFKAEWSAS